MGYYIFLEKSLEMGTYFRKKNCGFWVSGGESTPNQIWVPPGAVLAPEPNAWVHACVHAVLLHAASQQNLIFISFIGKVDYPTSVET